MGLRAIQLPRALVHSVSIAILVISLLPASAAAESRARLITHARAIPNSYLVTLADGISDPAAVAAELSAAHGGRVGHVYSHALDGFAIEADLDSVREMAYDPRVVLIEEDPEVKVVGSQSNPPYGLDRTDQRDLPLNNNYTYGATGAGTTVYVIDTGIRITHADFGGRASHGYDFVDNDPDASDCHGHGTHVAGTVGGTTYGIAKSTRLVGVRVLDCGGSGSGSDIIAGIDYVTQQHTAGENDVANMSLGTLLGTSSTIDSAVSNSIADGTTYAIAAGNGNALGIAESACNTSPSRVPEALTVSATDSNDRKASFANYGTCVDLFAPGVNITSSWYTSDTSTDTISGTSMASPHVAGVAAQYLEAFPGSTPAQVSSAINTNATTGKVTSAGSGSPNRLLYNAFIGGGTTPEPTPSPTPTSSPTASPTPSPSPSSPGDPDPGTPTLSNGVALSDTNGASGSWKYYKVHVPAGRSSLRIDLTGPSCSLLSCNPDLDLYVRQGAKPTESTYACRVYTSASSGTCNISNPSEGWWYVGVHVYSGSTSKSYSVKATY